MSETCSDGKNNCVVSYVFNATSEILICQNYNNLISKPILAMQNQFLISPHGITDGETCNGIDSYQFGFTYPSNHVMTVYTDTTGTNILLPLPVTSL